MVDTQDLHQIEYRHHQTRDLSPIASSMSRESVLGWDARIRAWVRHPHSETLSESVCYQVFRNGAAALAWRYWDKQAAVRADGSRGRPLVSRVLIGPAGVLTPEVAVALCRTGPVPDLVGPLPGQVADDAGLPMVGAAAVGAMAREMTAALDQEAAAQEGLQAVVAAALAEPAAPLAISAEDSVIRKPLRDGLQCPLMWGLYRIAGPVLGPAGREWSFSTFELPLGDMDPGSLPRIVFRELQYAAQPPPARTRREIQVRPFAPNALGAQTPYAARVGLAGWLVDEYQERGGDWLERFAARSCASEKTSQKRLERVYDALLAGRALTIGPDEVTRPVSALLLPAQAPAPGFDEVGFARAEPARMAADDHVADDFDDHAADESAAGDSGDSGDSGDHVTDEYAAGESAPAEYAADESAAGHDLIFEEDRPLGDDAAPSRNVPADEDALPEYPAGHPRTRYPERAHAQRQWPSTLSSLLQQLELVRDDPRIFDDHLGEILRIGAQSVDPDDRRKSWDVIRINGWYERISEENSFYKEDVAHIFRIILIPELGQPDVAEKIAGWALNAPNRMIEGLLLAAKKTDTETWHYVMRILEPVLALLHAHQGEFSDQWDPAWATRPAEYQSRGDGKGGGLWNRLRRG